MIYSPSLWSIIFRKMCNVGYYISTLLVRYGTVCTLYRNSFMIIFLHFHLCMSINVSMLLHGSVCSLVHLDIGCYATIQGDTTWYKTCTDSKLSFILVSLQHSTVCPYQVVCDGRADHDLRADSYPNANLQFDTGLAIRRSRQQNLTCKLPVVVEASSHLDTCQMKDIYAFYSLAMWNRIHCVTRIHICLGTLPHVCGHLQHWCHVSYHLEGPISFTQSDPYRL